MQVFQSPAAPSQFRGQPVEQLRVRRTAAVKTEIIGRIDETDAKVIVPEPIDDRAGE